MNATTSFVHELLRTVLELESAYDEHVAGNDVLLPHVFLGAVTRFVIAKANEGKSSRALVELLEKMESALNSGDKNLEELVVVSFIENLCGEEAAIEFLEPIMGPKLKNEVKTISGG